MMLTTGNQLKAARMLAGMDQLPLAEAAGVSVGTVRNMEAQAGSEIKSSVALIRAVQKALENAGIEFLNHGQPGVRLTAAKRRVVDDGNPPGHVTDPDEVDRKRI